MSGTNMPSWQTGKEINYATYTDKAKSLRATTYDIAGVNYNAALSESSKSKSKQPLLDCRQQVFDKTDAFAKEEHQYYDINQDGKVFYDEVTEIEKQDLRDGGVSDEYIEKNFPDKQIEKWCKTLDTDSDGEISQSELRDYRAYIDANNGGLIDGQFDTIDIGEVNNSIFNSRNIAKTQAKIKNTGAKLLKYNTRN